MDQSCSLFYSPWADLLSKFHTVSESIQALWIVAASVTALGVTYLVMRGVRETVALPRGRGEPHGRREPHGHSIHGACES
jgi:hypothetical protein